MQAGLVLIDCSLTPPDGELLALWKRSRFQERVARLGLEVLSWGPSPLGPTLEDRAALTAALDRSGADHFVVVDADQIFLDVDLALAGLADFDPAQIDSFTQWEHCRLPVGVGVRALATRTWRELGAASPREAFARLREDPAGHHFGYDVRHRVSYAHSLLDTRARKRLRARLGQTDVASWDMAGFLALDHTNLRYEPDELAPRVDERRMPAPYGFESPECAEFPTYVMFDITNVCNARCIHCPQGIKDEDGKRPAFLRNRQHQSLEVFRRVIDECAEHTVNFVRITADGEPLVHPDLFTMLEYARDKGVGPVGLTTNGSLLTAERAQRLLDSHLGVVDFSLDAAREKTFEEVRVGLSFEKTRGNVERFIALRNAQGAATKVMVSFVKQAANVDEVEEFRDYWAPRVDEVVIREMISNVGLNKPSAIHWPGWDARWPCAHFFRRVVINHQGMLKACPIDWEQRTVNRSVAEAGLYEQWHGDFYWSHRMQHLNDAIVESSACKLCPDWAGTPWELGYEKIIERLVDSMEAV